MWKLLLVVLLAATIQAKNTKRNYGQVESYNHKEEYAPEYSSYEGYEGHGGHKGYGGLVGNKLQGYFGYGLKNWKDFGISILLLGLLALVSVNVFSSVLPKLEITTRNLHHDGFNMETLERLQEIYNRFMDA